MINDEEEPSNALLHPAVTTFTQEHTVLNRTLEQSIVTIVTSAMMSIWILFVVVDN